MREARDGEGPTVPFTDSKIHRFSDVHFLPTLGEQRKLVERGLATFLSSWAVFGQERSSLVEPF